MTPALFKQLSAGKEGEKAPMSYELYRLSRLGAANLVELFLPVGLDIDEFDRLNEAVLGLIAKEPAGYWILDLSKLEYMGSASLGLMVNVRQRVKEGKGKLVLCGLSPRLIQIFRTCCMERLFKIVRTREEAGEAMG
jgi:anti-anti-sigma factor